MYGQSMDNGEIINIRWANDDPNPGGKKIQLFFLKKHIGSGRRYEKEI